MSEIEDYSETVKEQNVHDPITESNAEIYGWPTEAVDPNDEWPDAQEIRNASGVLEFLTALREEIDNFFEIKESLPQRETPNVPVRVQNTAASKWRGRNGKLRENVITRILSESPRRRRVTIWNLSGEMILLASTTFASTGTPPNTFILPGATDQSYFHITLYTTDDIYARIAVDSGIDVDYTLVEEFDL